MLNQFVSVSGFLGLTDMRAGPVIKFGSCAIARREYLLGLEAIQNGVSYDLQHGGSYTGDRENCLFVATQYDRAAQSLGWRNDQPAEGNNKQLKIGYVVSSIADEESSARTIASFARHHDSKRFRFQVYSTEANVRRDKQQFAQTAYSLPSSKRGKETIELLNRQKVTSWMAPTDGDITAAAKELASQLARDRVDVVIFDANQSDPIAAMIAGWDIASAKINLCRRSPLYAPGIQSVLYTDQGRFEADQPFWQKRNVDAQLIIEGIDADEHLGPAPQRSVYGIPDSAVVLATAGQDLDRTVSEELVETMVSLLRAHPHVVYLLIGEAELSWQKRKFESAGVSKRVGYAGRRKDLPGFLRIADIYVAEFPAAGSAGVLQAMSVERPVVAARCSDNPEESQAADLLGDQALTGRDPAAFIERVSKLIREPQSRARLGKALRQRVEQNFAFTQTARRIEQLCEQLVKDRSEAGPNEAKAQAA